MPFNKNDKERDFSNLTESQIELYEKLFEFERLNKGKIKIIVKKRTSQSIYADDDQILIVYDGSEDKLKYPKELSSKGHIFYKGQKIGGFATTGYYEESKNDPSIVDLEEYIENNKQRNASIKEFVSNNKGYVFVTINGKFPFDIVVYCDTMTDGPFKTNPSSLHQTNRMEAFERYIKDYNGNTTLIPIDSPIKVKLDIVKTDNIVFKTLDSEDGSIIEIYNKDEYLIKVGEGLESEKDLKKRIRKAKRRLFFMERNHETSTTTYVALKNYLAEDRAKLQNRERDLILERLLRAKKYLTSEEIEEQIRFSDPDIPKDELATKVTAVVRGQRRR